MKRRRKYVIGRGRAVTTKSKVRACTRCGCTDANACAGGCAWMPLLEDVCSQCATKKEWRAEWKRSIDDFIRSRRSEARL